ncbi:Heparan sulfate 2-O-sulfotransferase 1 [Penaeus vannamei]|uniref:Heparan sulfate 2-O-sulfotransferase 1 n=1 Tax=Penaeus vannamei TaxID=6689 RepID=A0A3R7MSS4_PENVA|nr:Heparan sulfate 2-O-sulfotransferase 1 [Penaeus vannamei]
MSISRRFLPANLCFATGRCARKLYGVLLVIGLSTPFYSLYLEGITHKLVERRSSPLTQTARSVPEVTPTARNVTPEHTRLLIYNRVPKCGSTTTFKILNTLRKINKFHHKNSEIYHTEWLSVEERKRLLQGLYKFTTRPIATPYTGVVPPPPLPSPAFLRTPLHFAKVVRKISRKINARNSSSKRRLLLTPHHITMAEDEMGSSDQHSTRVSAPPGRHSINLRPIFRSQICTKTGYWMVPTITLNDWVRVSVVFRPKYSFPNPLFPKPSGRVGVNVWYFYRLGFQRPAWMNIIREPVSRFISEFYFVRTREQWSIVESLKQKKRPPESWFNMQLDECAAAGHPECKPSPGDNMTLQLTFFCGHHPTCRQVGSRWALNQAKYHLENYYSVVGVLEELSLSLRVLQHYLPRFFNNVGALELGSGHVVLNERPKEYKPTVTNATKGMLRSVLKEDLELYQFARQRLYLQARAIGILDEVGG